MPTAPSTGAPPRAASTSALSSIWSAFWRDLAAEAALEPKYFCRVFRQITGRTPINYLNYYRVECAAELLCTTQGSITDIALECGFGDVSYFSRMFRRYKGQTPGQYRRAHLAAG